MVTLSEQTTVVAISTITRALILEMVLINPIRCVRSMVFRPSRNVIALKFLALDPGLMHSLASDHRNSIMQPRYVTQVTKMHGR